MTTARLKILPWLVLLASLGVTWLVWTHERQTAREQLRGQFDFALRDMAGRIEQRISTYEQILRGVQGLFSVIDISERHRLALYVDALLPDPNFSGIQAIGISELVPAERRDAHLDAMRRQGFADYDIHPDGQRPLYTPTVQREPNTTLNRARLGFDAWSDPVRREAMEKARDSGMPAISGKVRLMVDAAGAGAPPGFIMYMPIFAKGQPHDTIEHRRANLTGWILLSFRIRDVMASMYGELPHGLAFTIHDGVELTDRHVLYSSSGEGRSDRPATLAGNEYLVVGSHTWTLSARTLEGFETRYGRSAARFIAAGGIGFSLLLSLLVRLMATGRDRALQLAESMTHDLRASKDAAEAAQSTLAAQARNLAQSNADLEQFAYVASHDLRTPLRNIVSYAQLLERRYRGRLGDDANDFIDFIVENSRKMTLLISDLLEYSRASRQTDPLEPICASDALAQALDNLQLDLEAADARLCIGDLPRVLAVETHLISLFQNLIGNAVKYRASDISPKISIEAERAEGDLWRFTVADNGIGIDPDYHEKIFEIFQRLTPSNTGDGTGIGLTLCRRIVHRFGGTIWLESEPGRGTRFFFTLRDGSAPP